jgi:hypothetical protein
VGAAASAGRSRPGRRGRDGAGVAEVLQQLVMRLEKVGEHCVCREQVLRFVEHDGVELALTQLWVSDSGSCR